MPVSRVLAGAGYQPEIFYPVMGVRGMRIHDGGSESAGVGIGNDEKRRIIYRACCGIHPAERVARIKVHMMDFNLSVWRTAVGSAAPRAFVSCWKRPSQLL